jgi:hypothetical protein
MSTVSLPRSHFISALAGVFLGLLCSILASGGLSPAIMVVAPLVGLAFYAIPTLLGILLLRWLAGKLGKYESFTILAGLVALALSFGLAYERSVTRWITSRGELHGTILGGGPAPEDFGGHLLVLVSLAVWIAIMVAVALKWKHVRTGREEALDPREDDRISLYLMLDSMLILVVTVALLYFLLLQRREWSSPDQIIQRATTVLNDRGSSVGDRALALNTIERSSDPRAIELRRRAAREETGENQIAAAFSLLGVDDMLALSVLEKPLMQGGSIEGKVQPTTSHTPSEGLGVQVAGFGHIGTWKFGSSLRSVRDPAAVPILVGLMASSDADTREGAAGALRGIMKLKHARGDHWKPAWPASVDVAAVNAAMEKALNDNDEMVRYFAVGTLMETHLNPHFPAVFLFKEKETEELNYWKNPVGPDPLARHH